MKDSREKVENYGFTIRPTRMNLLQSLPQFSGKGRTEIMVELIEGAISGHHSQSPFASIGLVDFIPNYPTHDFSDIISRAETVWIHSSTFAEFYHYGSHSGAIAARLFRKLPTHFVLPEPGNPIEQAILDTLVTSAARKPIPTSTDTAPTTHPSIEQQPSITTRSGPPLLPDLVILTENLLVASVSSFGSHHVVDSGYALVWNRIDDHFPGEYHTIRRAFSSSYYQSDNRVF